MVYQRTKKLHVFSVITVGPTDRSMNITVSHVVPNSLPSVSPDQGQGSARDLERTFDVWTSKNIPSLPNPSPWKKNTLCNLKLLLLLKFLEGTTIIIVSHADVCVGDNLKKNNKMQVMCKVLGQTAVSWCSRVLLAFIVVVVVVFLLYYHSHINY